MKTVHRNRLLGVDFSGAKDAGDRIWIADGSLVGWVLHIERGYPASDLPRSGNGRDKSIRALRRLIAGAGRPILGLDFPFGLPRDLTNWNNWESFVLEFPSEYPSPEAFSQACRKAAPGRELKRKTDEEKHNGSPRWKPS